MKPNSIVSEAGGLRKSPAPSQVATIPADEVFTPLDKGTCPLLKK
jgi:hypothetical protein